jgi:hypothetical protein
MLLRPWPPLLLLVVEAVVLGLRLLLLVAIGMLWMVAWQRDRLRLRIQLCQLQVWLLHLLLGVSLQLLAWCPDGLGLRLARLGALLLLTALLLLLLLLLYLLLLLGLLRLLLFPDLLLYLPRLLLLPPFFPLGLWLRGLLCLALFLVLFAGLFLAWLFVSRRQGGAERGGLLPGRDGRRRACGGSERRIASRQPPFEFNDNLLLLNHKLPQPATRGPCRRCSSCRRVECEQLRTPHAPSLYTLAPPATCRFPRRPPASPAPVGALASCF